MRKYATAFTRTGTLSFVITSWGGMLSVIVRRSTFTIRSMIGISRKSPGPLGCASRRPSRKMMPRSYSRATLIALSRNRTRRNAKTRTMTSAAVMRVLSGGLGRSYGFVHRGDVEHEGRTDGVDADRGPRSERRVVGRARPPQLAVYEHEAVAAHDARGADKHVRADAHGRLLHLHGLRDRERPGEAERGRDADHERQVHVVRRGSVTEQHECADGEAGDAGERQGAVARDVDVNHEQRDPSSSSASPAQLIGRIEKPKSAVTSATPPSAPGSTTPGWKIS